MIVFGPPSAYGTTIATDDAQPDGNAALHIRRANPFAGDEEISGGIRVDEAFGNLLIEWIGDRRGGAAADPRITDVELRRGNAFKSLAVLEHRRLESYMGRRQALAEPARGGIREDQLSGLLAG